MYEVPGIAYTSWGQALNLFCIPKVSAYKFTSLGKRGSTSFESLIKAQPSAIQNLMQLGLIAQSLGEECPDLNSEWLTAALQLFGASAFSFVKKNKSSAYFISHFQQAVSSYMERTWKSGWHLVRPI